MRTRTFHPLLLRGLAPASLLLLACSHEATVSGRREPAVAPAIVTQPSDLTVLSGTNATFDVVASGTRPLTYQWVVNGTPAEGEVYSACTVWAATMAKSGTTFTVIVSNEAGSVTSQVARLTVVATDQAPAIATPPADLSVAAGNPAQFSVQAVGTGPLTYQWRRNGVPIPGAGSPGLRLEAVSLQDDGTVFTVEVANLWGTAVSAPARLTVH